MCPIYPNLNTQYTQIPCTPCVPYIPNIPQCTPMYLEIYPHNSLPYPSIPRKYHTTTYCSSIGSMTPCLFRCIAPTTPHPRITRSQHPNPNIEDAAFVLHNWQLAASRAARNTRSCSGCRGSNQEIVSPKRSRAGVIKSWETGLVTYEVWFMDVRISKWKSTS